MKKELKKKLVLSKQVIGDLSNIVAGVPPPTKWRCDGPSADVSVGGNCGHSTDCSVFGC